MIDPTNSILKLKEVFFILLLGYNIAFFKPNLKLLWPLLLVYCAIFCSYICCVVRGEPIVHEELFAVFKAFAPLMLLPWVKHYNVMKLSVIPAVLMGCFMAILYLFVSSSEVIELAVWTFVKQHNDFIMMTHRNFLGIPFFGMYYKSIISLVFTLFILYYKLSHTISFFGIVCVLLLTFAFLVSGTRATMLLPFAIIGLVAYFRIKNLPRVKYFLYPTLCIAGILFLGLILMLAFEKGEASNAMKYGHLTSYATLFNENPLYFIFGQGPCTKFYTIGFGAAVTQTEWTYIELIRNYGIFAVFMLLVMFYPVYALIKAPRSEYNIGILMAYICYLFIAGTNPLFISSTGMAVMLMIYSYIERLNPNLCTVPTTSAPLIKPC
jgi:hypothetical protein